MGPADMNMMVTHAHTILSFYVEGGRGASKLAVHLLIRVARASSSMWRWRPVREAGDDALYASTTNKELQDVRCSCVGALGLWETRSEQLPLWLGWPRLLLLLLLTAPACARVATLGRTSGWGQ